MIHSINEYQNAPVILDKFCAQRNILSRREGAEDRITQLNEDIRYYEESK